MSPTSRNIPSRLASVLAGLQAGMMGTLAMLVWLGMSAVWQRRTFWTSENLLATTFYGGAAVHNGFSFRSISGLALYLLLYSTLGCVFALVAGKRAASPRLVLAGIATGLAWYYLSFHLLWEKIGPLIPLLHAVGPTVLGHAIWGAALGRFPLFLPPVVTEAAPEPAPAGSEVRE